MFELLIFIGGVVAYSYNNHRMDYNEHMQKEQERAIAQNKHIEELRIQKLHKNGKVFKCK